MKKLALILILAASAFSSGCVYRAFSEGDAKYTSFAFGTTQQVAPFELKAGQAGTPGYRELSSKGLSNDPNAAIVDAAVTAAVKAAKAP